VSRVFEIGMIEFGDQLVVVAGPNKEQRRTKCLAARAGRRA